VGKIDVYNSALGLLGETKLSGLSESREPRFALDDAWTPAVNSCLESAPWNFALRAVRIDKSITVIPAFGWANAFAKPDDWRRTHILSGSETFEQVLERFGDEYDHWYADIDPIYVLFVSNDAGYGLDLSRWSQKFEDYVANELADRICLRVTSSESKLERIKRDKKRVKRDAEAIDAMNQANPRPPLSSWARSRSQGMSRGRSLSGGMKF
jgi:hypothetical protein